MEFLFAVFRSRICVFRRFSVRKPVPGIHTRFFRPVVAAAGAFFPPENKFLENPSFFRPSVAAAGAFSPPEIRNLSIWPSQSISYCHVGRCMGAMGPMEPMCSWSPWTLKGFLSGLLPGKIQWVPWGPWDPWGPWYFSRPIQEKT